MMQIADEPYDLDRVYDITRGSTPFIAPYDRLGRYGSSEAINNQGVQIYDNRNPLIDAANGNRRSTTDVLTANAFLQISFSKDLSFNATWSSIGRWNMIDRYNTPGFGYTDSGIETITKNYNREGLEMIRNFDDISMRNNLYTTLNYNKTFAGIHDISAIAGIQMEEYNKNNVRARRSNPPKPGLSMVDAGTSGIQGEGTWQGLRLFSYFGRINYALLQKYLFEVNFRADASSRFKDGNRWGYFPGFSVGWRLSEETFIKDMGIFSNLKLRASWGQLGNQNIEGYWPYLEEIAQNNILSYTYGGTFVPGAAVTAMVDPTISWETATTLDFGLDMGFFDNRLNIEADYFFKKTTGILVQLPMPLILGGLTAPWENIGEMENKGIEFTINYDNKPANKDRFGYSLGLNFTYIDNKVTKFRKDAPDQLRLIREGYSYRTLYGYKAIGIYQSDDEGKSHMHSNSPVPKAGNLKFEDVNGDGKLDFQDKQELGNSIPKVTMGANANFSYKNFDLNLLFQGLMLGNLFTRNPYTTLDYENQSISSKWRRAWTPENPNTDIPALRFNSSWDNSDNSFWVHRSDFVKLKNIQLGYQAPQPIASKLGMNRLYVYINAQNVFTLMMFKGYEGFDPERPYDGAGENVYPVARVVSFGLNLTF
jgi:TonB-linked SusC/RagA family outer membrane protein